MTTSAAGDVYFDPFDVGINADPYPTYQRLRDEAPIYFSAMLLLLGAACRDERRYVDPDRFDIRRTDGQHLVFGYGLHYCLGAALARLEGRIALDEILDRFPEWEVDYDKIALAPTSTVRGWERLPTYIGTSR